VVKFFSRSEAPLLCVLGDPGSGVPGREGVSTGRSCVTVVGVGAGVPLPPAPTTSVPSVTPASLTFAFRLIAPLVASFFPKLSPNVLVAKDPSVAAGLTFPTVLPTSDVTRRRTAAIIPSPALSAGEGVRARSGFPLPLLPGVPAPFPFPGGDATNAFVVAGVSGLSGTVSCNISLALNAVADNLLPA
jgi:hypothetical protein